MSCLVFITQSLFQLTRPRGARPFTAFFISSETRFQLTRPRGARHSVNMNLTTAAKFQLTRPRGARLAKHADPQSVPDFNSHARVGRDNLNGQKILISAISTHTPAWGATRPTIILNLLIFNFNSHARVGRDWYLLKSLTALIKFQLTRPRGARPGNACIVCKMSAFQLTRPRGARPAYTSFLGISPSISTHTPAWGATPLSHTHSRCRIRFQLTRPRGARPEILARNGENQRISTHTPAWGATYIEHIKTGSTINFNSHARVGRDPKTVCLHTIPR